MSGEKTEEPTEKRLRDERKKGNVPKSKDIPATLATLAILAYLMASAPSVYRHFAGLFNRSLETVSRPALTAYWEQAGDALKSLAWLTLPALAMGIILTLAGNWGQFGFLLSFHSLKPKPEKFNPAANLKQMFSPTALFNLMMSILKLATLSWIFYLVFSGSIGALVSSLYAGLGSVPSVLNVMMKQAILYFAGAFIVLAGVDYGFHRFMYRKQNRMSKDEVYREFKESEGDPHIKSRRRQLHEESLEQAIVEKTRKATVLIVNPTHFAVALFYDEQGDKLPVVVGKGEGRLAKKMIMAAEEEGIPIMRDVPLARGLFADSALDHQIPVEFIRPVAETLKWAKQFKRGI